jgi:hypothetical protein
MNTCNLNSDTLYLQYFLKNEMGNTWQILAALWLQSNGTNWIAQFFELNVPSPINRNKLVPYQKKKKIVDWIGGNLHDHDDERNIYYTNRVLENNHQLKTQKYIIYLLLYLFMFHFIASHKYFMTFQKDGQI